MILCVCFQATGKSTNETKQTARERETDTHIYRMVHGVYMISCVAPHVQNLSVHSRAQRTLFGRFVVARFRRVCAFLSLAYIPRSMAFFSIQPREEKKIHFFCVSPFIYSISNTFSDFNTSIALAAFVNEFFTSYALFRIFAVFSCFHFTLSAHSVSPVCLAHSGSEFISSCNSYHGITHKHTKKRSQTNSCPLSTHTHTHRSEYVWVVNELYLYVTCNDRIQLVRQIFSHAYLFNRKTQINNGQNEIAKS